MNVCPYKDITSVLVNESWILSVSQFWWGITSSNTIWNLSLSCKIQNRLPEVLICTSADSVCVSWSDVKSYSVVSNSLWPCGYSDQVILQARILEWVTFPFSRGSSQARNQTQVSHIEGGFFTSWATREAQEYWSGSLSLLQRIFPTQDSNRGLLPCRWILYQLSYQGKHHLDHHLFPKLSGKPLIKKLPIY